MICQPYGIAPDVANRLTVKVTYPRRPTPKFVRRRPTVAAGMAPYILLVLEGAEMSGIRHNPLPSLVDRSLR